MNRERLERLAREAGYLEQGEALLPFEDWCQRHGKTPSEHTPREASEDERGDALRAP
jgi:hypothetical protein